ncbi:hypothetical protein CFP56_023668 [Quercus suber]|uniref:Uncharacterized protein n=1 Tax=Quercus suber TaxID=58331 RepID=A0AAW0LXN2_QUESU
MVSSEANSIKNKHYEYKLPQDSGQNIEEVLDTLLGFIVILCHNLCYQDCGHKAAIQVVNLVNYNSLYEAFQTQCHPFSIRECKCSFEKKEQKEMDMNMDMDMYRCVECGFRIKTLFVQYSSGNI